MSVQEIVEKARMLSVDEQKQLIKTLVDQLGEKTELEPEAPKKQRSLRELRGLGKHLYDGTEAHEYINKIRDKWDDRP
jgi:hypothetical protein